MATATRRSAGDGGLATLRLAESDPSDHATPDAGDLALGEQLASLRPILDAHPELDLATIGYHLEQSDATAGDGYWHAAVNEARSFLEALVINIALIERRETLAEFRKGKETQGGLRLCRRHLQDVSFLDIDEDILLAHVHGIASAKGSHLGVTDETWCRLARQIVAATAHHLIRRYSAWKANDRKVNADRPGNRDVVRAAFTAARCRDWLANTLRRVVYGLSGPVPTRLPPLTR